MVIPMARWTALMGTAPCARALANEALSEQIREVFVASDATYGMPRVRAELTETGVVASRKRIARLMRDGGMRGVKRASTSAVMGAYAEPACTPRCSSWPS